MSEPYKVFYEHSFDEKLKEYDTAFRNWVDRIAGQLSVNPYVGKPLSVPWFREKKLGKFRIYYLIYEQHKCVYFVNISEKKDQQKIINSIKLALNAYNNSIKKLVELG